MDFEIDVCFVCAESCKDTYFFLINLASKKFKTKFTTIIADLINKEYELRVSDKNKICSSCIVLLEKYDELQQEARTVKSILSRQIASTYDIETSEEMVFMDNSKTFMKLSQNNGNEIKYSCKMCAFVTTKIESVNSHCLYHKIVTESKIQTNEIIREIAPVRRNNPIRRENSDTRNENKKFVKEPQQTYIEVQEDVTEANDDSQFTPYQEFDEEYLESLVDLDLLEDENCDSNVKNQICMMNQCEEEFKYIADYVKHLRKDHKSCTLNHIFAVVRANVKRPKKITKLSCPFCFAKAPNIELLEEHVGNHENTANSKAFNDRINQFVENLIKMANYGEEDMERWTCKYCEETFVNHKHYNNHLALEHRRCFICFSQCENRLILKDHISSHTSHSEFKCSFCRDIFQTKPDRLLHIQLNHKDSCCKFCPEWFESTEELSHHSRFAHADKKGEELTVNICDTCGASFKNKSLQQKHQVLEHQKRKIYTCSACRESFKFRYLLMNHISSAHNRTIVDNETNFYKCFICMRGYSSQNRTAFVKHLQEHQKSKSFCDDCNVDCTSLHHLEAHRERCHQDFSLKGEMTNFVPAKKPQRTIARPARQEVQVQPSPPPVEIKEVQVETTEPEQFNTEEQILVQTEDGSLLNVKDAMNIILTENGELLIQNLDELLPNEVSSNGQLHITNLEQFLLDQSQNEISYVQQDEEVVVDNTDSQQASLMETYKEIFEPTEEIETDGTSEYVVQLPLDQQHNFNVTEPVEMTPAQVDANQSTLDELGDILLEVAKAAEKEKKPKIVENKVVRDSLWGKKRNSDPPGLARKRATEVESEPASNFSQAYELFVKGFDAKKQKNF